MCGLRQRLLRLRTHIVGEGDVLAQRCDPLLLGGPVGGQQLHLWPAGIAHPDEQVLLSLFRRISPGLALRLSVCASLAHSLGLALIEELQADEVELSLEEPVHGLEVHEGAAL